MYTQILYWLFISGVLIETTRSQNVTESEEEETPLNVTSNNVVCEQLDLPEVVLLEPIPRHGPFPWTELTKLLKDKTVYAEYCQTKRLPTYCSKKNATTAEPGPGQPGVGVCPAETKVMEIPKFVSYNNMKCWVVHHWHSYCEYATCKFPTCRGVTPNNQSRQTKCVQTNFKHIYYYIICPNPWKLYKRYLILPQCCSCHLFNC